MESSLNSSSSEKQLSVAVFHHTDHILHQSSKKHPEHPGRVETIIDALKNHPELLMYNILQYPSAPTASEVEQLAADLQGSRYLEFIQQMWDPNTKRSSLLINTDTYYCKDSYQAALSAARTAIAATDYVLKNKRSKSYAVVRPPGHHSGMKSQPNGFCFLNNVALAAQKALKAKTASRIVILDWDVHHGDGTQTLFYNKSEVLYISLHRFDEGKFFPDIPQSGSEYIGDGPGKGFNINICWNLPQQTKGKTRQRNQNVGDEEYVFAFESIVLPVLKQYDPDLILVSCGFDAAEGDPLGDLALTRVGYQYMLAQLVQMKRPISVILQGGYNLSVLEWGSKLVVEGLKGEVKSFSPSKRQIKIEECNKIGLEGIQNCLKHIKPYWKTLESTYIPYKQENKQYENE